MAQFIKGKQIATQSITIDGVNGNVVAQGDLDMLGNAVIINASPTSNFEAANKAYVDSVAQGLKPHAPVFVTATAQIESGNVPSGTTYTIDSIGISVDDRVLLTNQGGTGTADSHIYNGIWQVKADGWIRPEDADGTPENEVSLGDFIYTTSGTTEISSGWVLSGTDSGTDGNITPNVEGQQWVKMAAPGSYTTDGQGIELSGNQFILELDGTTLSKSATGLKLANAVSTAISSNTDGVTSLSTAIDTETSLRTSADTSLSTNVESNSLGLTSLSTVVDTETSFRTAADTSLSNIIELNSIAVTSLSTAIDTETTARISGDTSLSTVIDTETSLRTSADTSLSTNVESNSLGLTSLSTVVDTETTARISGDTSLSNIIELNSIAVTSLSTAIDTETSLRTSADTSLSNVIDTETSLRTSADTSLSTNVESNSLGLTSLSTVVDTETSFRTAADTSLSTAIDTETSFRTAADTSLSTVIDTETSFRTAADTSLSDAIDTETSLRISTDSSLSTAINNIAAPTYSEKTITPANSGDTTAILVDASGFTQLSAGETVEEPTVMVYLNGLAYPFEWAQGTPAVFHTNGIQPNSSTATTLYFDGQVAGFAIETDDDIKLKYVVSN